MLVITCYIKTLGVEGSRIRKFLPQRRQDAKFRIILRSTTKHTNDTKTRKLSGPNFRVFRAFRGSIFGCRCAPTGKPLFPTPVWEKACTTIDESFRGLRKFFASRRPVGFGYASRQVTPSSEINFFSLRPLRSLREIFQISVAAEPRWALRGEPIKLNLTHEPHKSLKNLLN